MPKITFTDDDFARMQPPEKGFHLFELEEVSEKAAASKTSINYFLTFKVIESAVDDKNLGRSCTRMFNSKGAGFMLPFLAAVWNIGSDEAVAKLREDPEVEFSDLIGEKVWNEVVDEIFDGKPRRNMSDTWAAGASKPPF